MAKYKPKEALEKLSVVWSPSPRQAMLISCPVFEILFGGARGGGKLSPLYEPVLTQHGWKEIGSLKVGSKICATDGSVTEVIAVHPQGIKDIYKVMFEDGTHTEVGLEHLWFAWEHNKSKKYKNNRYSGVDSSRVYTTEQIINRINKGKRFSIPLCDPVSLAVQGELIGRDNFIKREIDPYLLGLLLGDGSIVSKNQINITSMDGQIWQFLQQHVGQYLRISDKENNQAKQFYFRGVYADYLWNNLEHLGLSGCKSDTKFIPRIYLWAPKEDRWKLLQ